MTVVLGADAKAARALSASGPEIGSAAEARVIAAVTDSPGEVTLLLTAWSEGDDGARDRLFQIVYEELRRRAQRIMLGERQGQTINTTALVHETYLRLTHKPAVTWRNQAHFLAIAAVVMRRILVEHARARNANKRGAGWQCVSLEVSELLQTQSSPDLLAVNAALEALTAVDALQARIVELRFFGGFSIEEAAEVLGISASTVKRDWRLARAWLRKTLEPGA